MSQTTAEALFGGVLKPGVGDGNFFITSLGSRDEDKFTVLYRKTFVTIIVRGSHDQDLKADMIQVMKRS